MTCDAPRWRSLIKLDVSTYLLGSVFLFYGRGSIILLPFLLGFLVRVVNYDPSNAAIPSFDRWFELLHDGVRMVVILFVYLILLPIVVLMLVNRNLLKGGVFTDLVLQSFLNPLSVTIAMGVLTGLAVGKIGPSTAGEPVIDTISVGANQYDITTMEPLILFVIFFYVYPAAVIRFSDEKTLWSAFDLTSLKPIVLDPGYFIRWILFSIPTIGSIYLLSLQVRFGFRVIKVLSLSNKSIILPNELNEFIVFGLSIVSFFLLVVAHVALGHFDASSHIVTLKRDFQRWDPIIYQIVVGGVLLSLGFSLPLVLVAGYVSKSIDHAADGNTDLPSFAPWRQLLVRGIPVTVVWSVCLAIPWTVLVLGQRVDDYALEFSDGGQTPSGSLSLIDQVTANAIVGISGLPLGSPLAYQFDRLGGDVLNLFGITVRSTAPYLVSDPWAIPPVSVAGFFLLLFAAWVVFPAAILPRRIKQSLSTPLFGRYLPFGFLGVYRDSEFRRAWLHAVGYWIVGGLPLVGWYVWRRYELVLAEEYRELTFIVLPSIDFQVAVPTTLSFLSIFFLLSASAVNFYFMSKSYLLLGTALHDKTPDPQ